MDTNKLYFYYHILWIVNLITQRGIGSEGGFLFILVNLEVLLYNTVCVSVQVGGSVQDYREIRDLKGWVWVESKEVRMYGVKLTWFVERKGICVLKSPTVGL